MIRPHRRVRRTRDHRRDERIRDARGGQRIARRSHREKARGASLRLTARPTPARSHNLDAREDEHTERNE